MPARTVLTIGNFDGVHLGHAALVRRARTLADTPGTPGRVVALAFSPHPMTVLAPARLKPVLTTFDQRIASLRALGADAVDPIEPTPEMLARTPDEFIHWLIERYHPSAIVEGTDFHFGKGRSGSVHTLAELGAAHGFAVDIVPPVEVALSDQTIVTASSSIARWLIGHGRMHDAALVLGRPYTAAGTVVRGDRRGRTLGFPTANLRTAQAIPGDGVYAGTAILADSRRFAAAIHVGPRATFDSTERTVEAHILDWHGPIAEGAEEYGWPLTLRFTAWIRGQARFDSADALVAQIARDVARVRAEAAPTTGPTPQEIVA